VERFFIEGGGGTKGKITRSPTWQEEEQPMKRIVFATIAVAIATSAFAQTTEFYVVQDTATKKCTIVDKKPTTTTTVVVGNGVYKTRAEAESGMKTVKVCSP
jgi:hypothetical protein